LAWLVIFPLGLFLYTRRRFLHVMNKRGGISNETAGTEDGNAEVQEEGRRIAEPVAADHHHHKAVDKKGRLSCGSLKELLSPEETLRVDTKVSYLEYERALFEKRQLLETFKKNSWWRALTPAKLVQLTVRIAMSLLMLLFPSFFDDNILREAMEGKICRINLIKKFEEGE
jgi:hypothetical protein